MTVIGRGKMQIADNRDTVSEKRYYKLWSMKVIENLYLKMTAKLI